MGIARLPALVPVARAVMLHGVDGRWRVRAIESGDVTVSLARRRVA